MDASPKATTRVEYLIGFHDKHLQQAISHRINIKVWENCKPDEVVAQRPVLVPGAPGQAPQKSYVNVTAKKALENEKIDLRAVVELVTIIEKMLKDEGYELPKEAMILPNTK